MGRGLFGSMFDFNRDGKMNAFERAAECQFLHEVVLADDSSSSSDSDSSGLFTSDGDNDSFFDDDDEIAAAGLDRDELSWMDADERRDALEAAGLDPDDYDDFDF